MPQISYFAFTSKKRCAVKTAERSHVCRGSFSVVAFPIFWLRQTSIHFYCYISPSHFFTFGKRVRVLSYTQVLSRSIQTAVPPIEKISSGEISVIVSKKYLGVEFELIPVSFIISPQKTMTDP